MRRLFKSFIIACLLVSAAGVGFGAEPRTFSHPDRIRYDGHCLTIEGKDVFIYSGSFHYFRCPKPLWRDRFQKIKDAGFNTVETYVAWNWHERQMPSGTGDFSKMDLADLEDWLKMAEDFGFYIIVRPGPYICAEWDSGGYPQWLMTRKPSDWKGDWLRSDEPVYLAWCRHWYDAVCPVIARHQITRKPAGSPGVILVQVENEYDFARSFSDDVKRNQVKALAAAALAGGIDVPLFTCWTKPVRGSADPVLRQIFDSCNFYPRWNVEGELNRGIDALRSEQPDAPLMTTELQGGWFSQVGGLLSEDQDGVTAPQIQNLTLYALQKGDTLVNYYMLFGGSNPGDWGARGMTTTYDYNAPIREWGGVGDRYQRVRGIGEMLREHGSRLARADVVECETKMSQDDVTVAMRRAADGSRYLFLRTSQNREPRTGTARVKEKGGESAEIVFSYELEPFGAKVLYLPPGTQDAEKGEWLPKPAPAIARPAELPPKAVITSARVHNDTGPEKWSGLMAAKSLAQAGIYDNRFVFYRAAVSLPAATNLMVEYPAGDAVLALVNGRLARRLGGTTSSSMFALAAGSNEVKLLYENRGHANGGIGMEQAAGILGAELVDFSAADSKAITGWRRRAVDGTTRRPEVQVKFSDEDWEKVSLDSLEADRLPAGGTAVYRARLEVSDGGRTGGRLNLSFGRIDGLGWVYLNGRRIAQTAVGARYYSFDVTKDLKAGTNVIALIVKSNQGIGGVGLPSLDRFTEGSPVALEAWGDTAGAEGRWTEAGFDDSHWQAVEIGAATEPDAVLKWYRMNFELESPRPDVWVPWRLRLNATGNGFIYLNGHALGRYWEAGPQHDFFLPECWLNFGAGPGNNLTLSLRPGEKGAMIQSAIVEPYEAAAEKRQAALRE